MICENDAHLVNKSITFPLMLIRKLDPHAAEQSCIKNKPLTVMTKIELALSIGR